VPVLCRHLFGYFPRSERRFGCRLDSIILEYRIQRALGDPSPAHVVAREFGLTPANVRQIDCRMRKRVAALISSTPRFATLREVRWFAA
jgi:hypothetical protein